MIAEDLALLGADQLLATLLPGQQHDHRSHEPQHVGPAESAKLVALCQNNRLAPLLGEAVHTGQIALASEALPDLFAAIEHYLASQLRVESQGMTVIDALGSAGIDFRMLKGMATAYLDYPNPAIRPIGDLDILIRGADMPRAIKALTALDAGEFLKPPRNDWRVTHAIPFRIGGIEVDLHHRLLHQAAGHCAAHLDLFADPDRYEIVGRKVFGMPPWLRLIQAASQNVLGGYQQLSSDLDVARLAAHVDVAVERASKVGLGWVVSEGVRRSQANLGWGPAAAAPGRLTWRDRWFKRTYGSDFWPSVLERSVFELATAPPSIAFAIVRSTLQPGDEYLESRSRSASQQLTRQLDRLRRMGR